MNAICSPHESKQFSMGAKAKRSEEQRRRGAKKETTAHTPMKAMSFFHLDLKRTECTELTTGLSMTVLDKIPQGGRSPNETSSELELAGGAYTFSAAWKSTLSVTQAPSLRTLVSNAMVAVACLIPGDYGGDLCLNCLLTWTSRSHSLGGGRSPSGARVVSDGIYETGSAVRQLYPDLR